MGEWSDYFEDFPEENPANYDENGRYIDREQRRERSQQELANRKLDEVLKKKGLLKKYPDKK